MAKIDGIVEIQGTVKGVTFYRTKDGMLARAKGGIMLYPFFKQKSQQI